MISENSLRRAEAYRLAQLYELRGGTGPTKPYRLLCGARCKDGHACRWPSIMGKVRCRIHGGLSTGPTTAAGRDAIRESNRRRAGSKYRKAVKS